METPETTSETPERACASCGNAMERHQDWCLECGTAAPGRLAGARPGWRAVGTTLALTLVLVGGAGAASYAALSSDANREAIASVPGDGTPLAQAPPGVPAPAAPVIPAPESTSPATIETPATKLPKAPKASEVPTPAPTPTPPPAPIITPKETPAPTSTTQKSTPEPKADPVERGQGTSAGGGGKDESDAQLEAISLGAGSVSVYDPYDRAVNPRDTADAYDSDTGTSFALTAKDDDEELQVGLTVDLESRKKVRGVELTVGTEAGRAELYATDSGVLPPDILDTRWDHPASRPNLSGTERILFPKGGANYRFVTFWFTVPPKSGRTIEVKELKLLG